MLFPISACTPYPSISLKLVTSILLKSEYSQILWAIGCFELNSILCNICIFSSLIFLSTTLNFPFVKVPVLSKTIFLIPLRISKLSLDFIKIPFLLNFPIETTIASGVAIPSAQGHATTKTVTKTFTAIEISLIITKFKILAKTAIIKIAGTNIPLTLSTNFWISVLLLVASTTILTIFEILVSLPILTASYSIYPLQFIEPAITSSPISLWTGLLSPVIKASLIFVLPFLTIPSTAIFSPGLHTIISPLEISLIVTVFSSPSTNLTAFLGVTETNPLTASVAFILLFLSINLPILTNNIVIAEASKYKWCNPFISPLNTRIILNKLYK